MNIDKVNLGPGSGTRAVAVEGDYSVIGNIDSQLAPAKPIAFRAPTAANIGQPSVTPPDVTATEDPKLETKTGFHWWWALPVLAVLGLLGFLPRLLRKRTP